MSRTITALFDTKADADAGAERLRQAGVDAGHVSVHDQTTHKTDAAYSTDKDKGLWASVKNVFVPTEDRHAYEEGIRRGGFLLTADVDDDKTPAAVKALEEANSVDLDARTQEWRQSGWDYAEPADDLHDADEGVLYGSRDLEQGGSRYRSYLP
ncbi:general stress protein [Sphingomonas bacterium]|uniref:general stress protein n=1 Tax=Sphingomonas bacterium TaxID=1895847 RepID=UPI0020C6D5D1|nr:general stress protein [Sphingomonas bacterium]